MLSACHEDHPHCLSSRVEHVISNQHTISHTAKLSAAH